MAQNALSYNLKRLRIMRRLSMNKIAEEAGISRVAYSNIENGKAEPRVSNLQKIADVLGVGIQELVASIPNLPSLRFRSQKTLRPFEISKRAQIIGDVAIWLKDFDELERMLSKKSAYILEKFRSKYRANPPKAAEEARDQIGLKPKEVINDICGLLENKGIKIYPINSDLNKFFGLSVGKCDSGPAIIVNTADSISIERQIFTVAHELGHILFHEDSYNADETKIEKKQEDQADEFASYFLMPQKAFEDEWNRNEGKYWLDIVLHVKRFFKVSYKVVLKRLIDMGVADNSLWAKFYRTYEQKFGRKLTAHEEPRRPDESEKEPDGLIKADFGEDRLSRLIKEAVKKESITLSRAAEILKKDIEEMREIANSWEMFEWQKITQKA